MLIFSQLLFNPFTASHTQENLVDWLTSSVLLTDYDGGMILLCVKIRLSSFPFTLVSDTATCTASCCHIHKKRKRNLKTLHFYNSHLKGRKQQKSCTAQRNKVGEKLGIMIDVTFLLSCLLFQLLNYRMHTWYANF